MDGYVAPLLVLIGGGTLLYLGLRRGQKRPDITEYHPTTMYCDLRSAQPCGDLGECIPLYDQGAAPAGYENTGICFMEPK